MDVRIVAIQNMLLNRRFESAFERKRRWYSSRMLTFVEVTAKAYTYGSA
jgi:hypothetical protein